MEWININIKPYSNQGDPRRGTYIRDAHEQNNSHSVSIHYVIQTASNQ